MSDTKIERIWMWAEYRYRFWTKSFFFPTNMVSDGGLYKSIAEAKRKASDFLGNA